ncbi:MAG: SAM-dependent methyltransferase, partial [Daejeonella sp.]
DFYISKKVAAGKIVKSISFEHKNKDYSFKEEVKAFNLGDFEKMFEKSGFRILGHFGDYSLNPYEELRSDRVIFICSKADA